MQEAVGTVASQAEPAAFSLTSLDSFTRARAAKFKASVDPPLPIDGGGATPLAFISGVCPSQGGVVLGEPRRNP